MEKDPFGNWNPSEHEVSDTFIQEIAELGAVCPSCGSTSIAVHIKIGNFSPVIGMCYSRAHCWHIEAETLAFKDWKDRKHWRR